MIILSLIFWLVGLALLGGGIWLITLDGSWYYALAGIVLIVVGALTRSRRPAAQTLYALFLIATAAWSLWESGYDWWPLATRLGIFLILAIPLLITPKSGSRAGLALLLPVWAIIGVGTLASLTVDAHRVEGELSRDVVSEDANIGDTPQESWHAYGRNNLGQRYSPLEQITPENVTDLELAWQYQTGDVKRPEDVTETTYEATPLKIDNSLFLCTPHNWLIALDADTGEEQWVYDAKVPDESSRQHQTCRGVSYLPPSSGEPDDIDVQLASGPAEDLDAMQCDAQLFMPTSDARLIAVDPATGARCSNFADNGELDLLHNMPFKQAGFYYSTSPPVVADGKVIVAGSVNDNYAVDSPSGVIRAYDAKTGELVWNWDSGNPEETAPIAEGETYTTSSPNSWSIASADEELGMVYFPMGNRTPDQLGMYRSEAEEKYSSSVVALNLETGQVEWVQQFVHHDLWDMDTPAQPSLLDLDTEQGTQPALVIPTKQGDVYVLNRETGEPILPVSEQPAPQGTIEGDHAAETQPISSLSFRPPTLREADMWGATPFDQLMCRIQFKSLRYEGQYTPPSEQGTIVFPGNFGVFNWGSIAVDPKRQVMFGMPLYLAFTSTLVPKEGADLGETNQGEHGLNENAGGPYAVEMKPFLSPFGVPCQQPPWGYVAGTDLRTGEIAWKHKNGTIEDMTALPLPIKMGVPGIGGPIITESGVVFLAASVDDYLRGYDLSTGEQLWQTRLPAGGQATPMTYLNSQGEQMVVQVAGGHGSIGTTIGDYVVAYKLKQQ
ncbi:glucose/quinate/shikimate family membrane-bound PQQ-dependent dehydrogenase [Halomonas elongata]|uniref:Glucose/quinate/shikimate family membrane-bound PQQ-dependent dehydrogenase n=1 Tax=Halomonas elongata (strain ATCC 33173 / DSM 2581 / NBRC 15536 / NCIMB 2198 / 1H9) TaxID=768066 RepID=E1VA02_HALED|nr:glucose/quinate/shikimate family membrane-bound PQQ-dependent dehydrogenase [Halomonas elongata]WBF17627.1 glucose/quinate/shikimate family membrane-bound PQQ-dependent dehydrogenase [Halomonas elongata]WPU46466.1 glucose/quinate/shikimate family membrane-bound PQQ-dependent dehydrogenase [Halomonas elongata DSM 2581]CBV43890.1 quinoprotein glucose dehydrogenase [Halomonas elongata DSM 2581]